jgi:predicted O-methyltransferase YrrM
MLTLSINHEEMCELDMSGMDAYCQCQYIPMAPGIEHYRLLRYLARQLPEGSVVIDAGTSTGASAISMAYENEAIRVITYDTMDQLPTPSIRNVPNIEVIIGNVLHYAHTMTTVPMIFLDIDPHDGVQEREFILSLERVHYQGIVVCDDIHLNDGMRWFWRGVKQEKLDATKYGHWSGTGIILFNREAVACCRYPSYFDV